MMEDPYEELANSYEVRKVQRWKQFSEAFHKRFVEGDKSSDWRKPLSDKLDDIYEFNSCYNKLLAENGLEDGDDGDEEENMADCDVESDVSSEKNSEFMPRTNTQQSAPGPINSIKRRAAFLRKYGPHSSSNSPPSDDIEEETFCLLKSVDGKGVKSKKVRIRASNGSIACSTEDRSCNSMISKQKGKYKSRDSFQAKENGDEAVKTPSGLWEVDENKGSLLENRDTEDNDIKKRHVRKECSSSEVTVSVNSETGAVSQSQKYKRYTSVLKLKDDSTSVKGRELNDVLSLLDEKILSDSSGKRITRSRLRATCTPVAALKPSSLSLSTSASLFPNETSDQSPDSISVLSEAPTQIFTSVKPRKVNNKGRLTNMSEYAKNGTVRTASSTPNRVVPPKPQELSDLFSPIQSSSKNLGAVIQSNSVKVNDETNSNQLFTPQNFENCVRQAVTLILSTFIPNSAASQGQPNTEQRPASNAESLNAQQQQISSSNLAWSNLLLQNPFFTPGSISNLLSGSGLVHQPTPQEKIHLKSPIMGSNAFGDDSGALRSRELTLVRNKSAGTVQLEVPIVEKRSLSSKVSNESQQTSPILSIKKERNKQAVRKYRRKQKEYFLQLKNEFEKLGEEIPPYGTKRTKGTKTLEDDEITCLEDLKKRKSNKRGALAAKRYRERKRKYIKQLESILMQKRGFILKEH